MGRGTETRRMQSAVLVRMPGPLAEAVESTAKARGLSSAAWLRGVAADLADAPADTARPSPPKRDRVTVSEDLAEVSRMAAIVERNNGAVVQLCKSLRERGDVLHADAEAVLADLRRVAAELHDLVGMLR